MRQQSETKNKNCTRTRKSNSVVSTDIGSAGGTADGLATITEQKYLAGLSGRGGVHVERSSAVDARLDRRGGCPSDAAQVAAAVGMNTCGA